MQSTVFSHRFKELRLSKGLNQPQLGELLGFSKHSIYDIETGRRIGTADKLIVIADFFDVSVDYLLGRTDEPQPGAPRIIPPAHVTVPEAAKLTSEQQEVLNLYENLSSEDQIKIKEIMRTFTSLSEVCDSKIKSKKGTA